MLIAGFDRLKEAVEGLESAVVLSGLDRDMPICVGSSFGNDSVALIQWFYRNGFRNVIVLYNDTGWARADWPPRIERLSQWIAACGYRLAMTKSEGLESLVKRKKAWPRQGIQFCTDELKIKPTLEWLRQNDPDKRLTFANGKRRAESKNRSKSPEWIDDSPLHGGRRCWQPLVRHSDEERDALIYEAGFEPLPYRSKECKICINENRGGLRTAWEEDIADVRRVENELNILFGVTANGKPRTMFRPYRHMGATGIDEVVRWARSDRGKFDLDDGTGSSDDGCDGGYCGI